MVENVNTPSSAVRLNRPIAIIDPLGAHGGFHYYVDGMARGLVHAGVLVRAFVTELTGTGHAVGYRADAVFGTIYGSDPALRRGLRFAGGMLRALVTARRAGVGIVFLHAFHYDLREMIAILGARVFGLTPVVTLHDIETFGHAQSGMVKTLCLRAMKGMVFLNEFSKAEFERLRGPSHVPSAIVPHGHYLDAFPMPMTRAAARVQLGLPVDKTLLLFFGNPREEKGLDLLITALGALTLRSDWHLVVAGKMKPEQQETFRGWLASYDLAARVTWNPTLISDADAVAYYRASDLVVLPYRRVYESGVAIMAMSLERAVLTSDLAPFRDLTDNGACGLMFDAGDGEGLRATLLAALDCEDLDAIGTLGHARVSTSRDWRTIGGTLAQFAQQVESSNK